MPTYEYRCKSCSTELEVVQSFTDDPLTTCEACGGDLRKIFGAPGISFKGSGFYKTDSRSSSKDKDSKPASSEKTDAKADKPASSDKPSGDKSSGDKSSGDKPKGDKGSKAPAASSAS